MENYIKHINSIFKKNSNIGIIAHNIIDAALHFAGGDSGVIYILSFNNEFSMLDAEGYFNIDLEMPDEESIDMKVLSLVKKNNIENKKTFIIRNIRKEDEFDIISIPILTNFNVYGVIMLQGNFKKEMNFLPALTQTGLLFGFFFSITRQHEQLRYQKLFLNNIVPFIPKTIVEEAKKGERFKKLQQSRSKATVLFADLRGFTSMVDNKDSEIVFQILDNYFEEMSKIIYKYKGIIEEFAGDEIYAIFGIPFSRKFDAIRAVAAGTEMVKKLHELNKTWEKKYNHVLDVGVGISTGIVTAGNLGSQIRKEYTVIGTSINVAARIEQLNKKFKTNLLISEHTLKEVENYLILRDLGKVILKGVNQPVGVYEILSLKLNHEELNEILKTDKIL